MQYLGFESGIDVVSPSSEPGDCMPEVIITLQIKNNRCPYGQRLRD